MTSVLIFTMPSDSHATYVHLALQKKGCNSVLWQTADFPLQQTHSFEFDNNKVYWTAKGPNFLIEHSYLFDVVWYRRPRPPSLSELIHPEDQSNSERENKALFSSFCHLIATDALWINRDENAKKANCKALQLKIAMQLGFLTPKTLMSNDPAKIKSFIRDNGPGNTIYKTFCPLSWQPNPNPYGHLAYSTIVNLESLSSDNLLQTTAGIFQKKISKAFELRVTYFGVYPVAVKLNSQEHIDGIIDWRAIPTQELKIEPYILPDIIHEKCKSFMNAFGLEFGCFDFIVTPDNDYYFLEINEQGQFLWLEELNPEIKMLDIFSEFLINKKKCFAYQKNTHSVSLQDFDKQAAAVRTKNMIQHVATV